MVPFTAHDSYVRDQINAEDQSCARSPKTCTWAVSTFMFSQVADVKRWKRKRKKEGTREARLLKLDASLKLSRFGQL